jgi:hypothetical protein
LRVSPNNGELARATKTEGAIALRFCFFCFGVETNAG